MCTLWEYTMAYRKVTPSIERVSAGSARTSNQQHAHSHTHSQTDRKRSSPTRPRHHCRIARIVKMSPTLSECIRNVSPSSRSDSVNVSAQQPRLQTCIKMCSYAGACMLAPCFRGALRDGNILQFIVVYSARSGRKATATARVTRALDIFEEGWWQQCSEM